MKRPKANPNRLAMFKAFDNTIGKQLRGFYTRLGARALFLGLGTVFLLLGVLVLRFPPQAVPAKLPPHRIDVTVQEIEAKPYRPVLDSYGIVRPRTQGALVAQVGGMVMEVNPNFRSGGFFDAGETLLVIDPSDYEVALTAQEAALAEAEHILLLEQARADQAMVDWQRMGNQGSAPDLVLRKPQLASARARTKSAEAGVERARLDLKRTRIRAPYAGRMLEQQVDLGQVVSSGAVLGTIYATDYMEVRLALRNSDLDFVDLPEPVYPGTPGTQKAGRGSRVDLSSNLFPGDHWSARIVRTESALDDDSRQLHVIVQIDDPYGLNQGGKRALKIGEYVTAKIQGRLLESAIVVGNQAIYQNSFVYLLENNLLVRRAVEILWQNEEEALLGTGLRAGDVLVSNRIGNVAAGYPVTVVDRTGGTGLDVPGTTAARGGRLIATP